MNKFINITDELIEKARWFLSYACGGRWPVQMLMERFRLDLPTAREIVRRISGGANDRTS